MVIARTAATAASIEAGQPHDPDLAGGQPFGSDAGIGVAMHFEHALERRPWPVHPPAQVIGQRADGNEVVAIENRPRIRLVERGPFRPRSAMDAIMARIPARARGSRVC
jgi:hypothetical protein